MIFVFFIVHFITGNFKTNLIKKYPSKTIDSLQDLADSSCEILFIKLYPIDDVFRSSSIPVYKEIWSKCVQQSQCVRELSMNEFYDGLNKAIEGKLAMIAYSEFMFITKTEICRKYKRSWMKSDMHLSKPFILTPLAFIMVRDVPPRVKHRLDMT
jgi:hypothetical protein